jgi:hypothetical protein
MDGMPSTRFRQGTKRSLLVAAYNLTAAENRHPVGVAENA